MTLLAFHIEAALDTNESDLVHSMSHISISQTMLLLSQGKDIPAIKGALPLFEEILTKKRLQWKVIQPDQGVLQYRPDQDTHTSTSSSGNVQRGAEGDSVPQVDETVVTPGSISELQEQFGADAFLDMDWLDFNFLNTQY